MCRSIGFSTPDLLPPFQHMDGFSVRGDLDVARREMPRLDGDGSDAVPASLCKSLKRSKHSDRSKGGGG